MVKLLNVTLILILLSGCVLESQFPVIPQEGPVQEDPAILDKATIQGFAPGSHNYQETPLRRYKVMATAGNYQKGLKSKTPKGYTFFTSVQGAITSSEEIE